MKTLVSVLQDQFTPDWRVPHVTAISCDFLRAHGIRALVLDLDNTLVPWRSTEIHAEIRSWIERLRAAGIGLCIVSNTRRMRRIHAIGSELRVVVVPLAGKPRRRGFRRALALLGVPPSEAAVVGDQLITDVWGGNRTGLRTIRVEPLSEVEFIATRLFDRNVERLIDRWVLREPHAARQAGDAALCGVEEPVSSLR